MLAAQRGKQGTVAAAVETAKNRFVKQNFFYFFLVHKEGKFFHEHVAR
jgi:hypothetical protein